MSDLQLLFVVLIVVYGWECACWIRRGSVAIVTWLGRTWRVRHPGGLLGNVHGAFIFAPPLPPLGTFLTGTQLPFSLSPAGVVAYVPYTVNPGWSGPQTGRFHPFDQIKGIEARGKKIRVNGELFVKASSPMHARQLAGWLQELVKVKPDARAAAIQKIFRDSFDDKAIRNRWTEFQERCRGLRWPTNAIFALLCVISPAVIWHFGLRSSWIPLVASLLALTTTATVLFHRAHKALYPGADDERFNHAMTILLSPVTSIRAQDVVSRPLFEAFHPVALAQIFCSAAEFEKLARRTLIDIRFPGLPLSPSGDPAQESVVQFSRQALQGALEEFLKAKRLDLDKLAGPPVPLDETCRAYCPRCGAQFTMVEGECPDCRGLRLVVFE